MRRCVAWMGRRCFTHSETMRRPGIPTPRPGMWVPSWQGSGSKAQLAGLWGAYRSSIAIKMALQGQVGAAVAAVALLACFLLPFGSSSAASEMPRAVRRCACWPPESLQLLACTQPPPLPMLRLTARSALPLVRRLHQHTHPAC